MKIRTKFSLFTSVAVLLTTAAVAVLAYLLQKDLVLRNQAREREAQTVSFAAVCRQSRIVSNELFMINYVRLLLEEPGIEYAYFADDQGKILVHSDKRFLYKTLSEWAAQAPAGVEEARQPVMVGDRAVGEAVVGFSAAYQRSILQRALRKTLVQVAAAASVVATVMLVAALIFAFVLTRPLKDLTKGSEEISQGRFDTRVRVTSKDELGDLAGRFNEMAQNLAVLDELKDEFVSSVSHDLRSPMSAINMYTNFMLNEDPDRDKIMPQHREFLSIIQYNAARLGIFVTNILDAAKIKAGRAEYHPQPMDVRTTTQSLQSLFYMMAQKKNIRLATALEPDLPNVIADPERFDHVIVNLLSNALKFTPDGGVITLGGRRAGGEVEVYVQDTGKGISEEDQKSLFQRFRQVAVADQRAKRIKGTGLGLYIVKQTVEGMGGRIRVWSESGKGTAFIITLPATDRPAVAPTA